MRVWSLSRSVLFGNLSLKGEAREIGWRAKTPNSWPRIVAFVFLSFLAILGTSDQAAARTPDDEPERDPFLSRIESSLARLGFEEDINPFTGQLHLRIPLVNLPGRGGHNLKVQLAYSSEVWNRTDLALTTHVASIDTTDHAGAGGWQLHMGKVINPGGIGSPNITQIDNPLVVMPDGSSRILYGSLEHAGEFISQDRWRYRFDSSSATWFLTDTDGTVYEFSTQSNAGSSTMRGDLIAQCIGITDVNGNQISISYVSFGLIDEITDTLGRRVEFTYHTGSDRVRFVRLKNGATTLQEWELTYSSTPLVNWTHPSGIRAVYGLTKLSPPTGADWTFEYNSASSPLDSGALMLSELNTPAGATLEYDYAGENFEVGCQSGAPVRRVVLDRREVSGRDLATGTWTYSYANPGEDGAQTSVAGPSGYSEAHVFEGWDSYSLEDGDMWRVGRPLQRTISDPEQTVVETFTWAEGEALSFHLRVSASWANCGSSRQTSGVNFPKPSQVVRAVTRDGRTYTTTQSSFDTYGNPELVSETGDLSRDTELEYWYSETKNILSGRLTLRDPSPGGRVRFWYDSLGRLERQNINPSSDTATDGVNTEFTYDSSGRLVAEETENGSLDRETRFENYSFGVPEREEYEQGVGDVVVTRDVSTLGLVLWEDDGRSGSSFRTHFSYDSLGRVIEVDPPVGEETTISYASNLSTVTVSRGSGSGARTEVYSYNGLGQLTKWEDIQLGDRRELSYNTLGRLVEEKFFRGGVTADRHFFDDLGRRTEVRHADGTSVFNSYVSNTTTITDELGHQTALHYDSFGDPDQQRLANVVDAEGSVFDYSYGSSSGLLTLVSPPGTTADREFTYTSEQFLSREEHPEFSGDVVYTYSPAGDRTRRDRGGIVVDFDYDRLGRLEKIDPSSTGHDVTYEYLGLGLRTESSNSYASVATTYDGAQRATSTSTAISAIGSKTVSLSYDGHDRVTRVTYPSGRELDYDYNSKGQLIGVVESGAIDWVSNISYTTAGDISTISYGNGASTTFGYDSRFRPDSVVAGTHSISLGYDNAGNVTSWVADGLTRVFDYDNLNRLVEATGPVGESISYEFSTTGNWEERVIDGAQETYSYNSSQQLTAVTGPEPKTFTYDGSGRVATANSQTYSYTPLDRLETASSPSVSFTYDGDGRRVSRTLDGNTTYFVRDARGQVVAEYDQNGQILREHVYALGRRVASVLADGTRLYVQHDPQGSAWLVSTETGDLLQPAHVYRPFGVAADAEEVRRQQRESAGDPRLVSPRAIWGATDFESLTSSGRESTRGGEIIFADGFESGCFIPWSFGDPSECGDGVVIQPEQCDLTCLAGKTCTDLGFDGGSLGCYVDCSFNTEGCSLCGNNLIEAEEICDGTDLDGMSCQSLGFVGGSLSCLPGCDGFDTSACHNCGNSLIDPGEECDLGNLNGQTCETLGLDGGLLVCTSECLFDLSGCHLCGNDVIEGPELCDGSDLGGETCQSQGYDGGALACVDCQSYDTSGCHLCGNEIIEFPEICDGSNLDGETCESQGYDGGTLGCTDCMSLDTSACHLCGNEIIEFPEVCDGSNLDGLTCTDFGFSTGTLACLPGCLGFDTSGCVSHQDDPSAQPRFAAQEFESELGLYYVAARYLDPEIGRFTTPDLGPVRLENPQTLNRYAYASNNPYRYHDPSGQVIDTIADVAFVSYDIFDISRSLFRGEGVSGGQITSLGGNLLGALIPGLTGGGKIAKTLAAVGDEVPTAKGALSRSGRQATGGRATALSGRAAEDAVSNAVGIPVNRGPGRQVVPGSGAGGIRIPDLKVFGPNATIAVRGSIIEVKNVQRISGTRQIVDLAEQARRLGGRLEIFTNAPPPRSGRLRDLIDAKQVELIPLPGGS